mmetsp:Transcript_8572/g.15845  ORF Transcript_8572/g.15845 Transcript_8572/m.15845 type:complete len:680 (-) Transcript_8572:114-2153(-)
MSENKSKQLLERIKNLSHDDLVSLCVQQQKKIKQTSGFKKLAGQYLKKNKALTEQVSQLQKQSATQNAGSSGENEEKFKQMEEEITGLRQKLEQASKDAEEYKIKAQQLLQTQKQLSEELTQEKITTQQNSTKISTLTQALNEAKQELQQRQHQQQTQEQREQQPNAQPTPEIPVPTLHESTIQTQTQTQNLTQAEEIKALETKLAEYTEKLEAKDREIGAKVEELSQAAEKQQELAEIAQNKTKRNEELEVRVRKLEEKNKEILTEKEEGVKKLAVQADRVKQMKIMKRALKKLQKDREALAVELKAQAQKSEQLKSEHEKELGTLKSKISDIDDIKNTQQEAESSLRTQIERIQATNQQQLTAKEQLIDELSIKNASLTREIEGVRLHMKDLEDQHKTALQQTNLRVEGLKSNHKTMIQSLQHQNEQEKSLLEARIQEMIRESAENMSKVAQYESDVKKAQQEVQIAEEKMSEMEELRNGLEEAKETARGTKRRLNSMQQMIARKERQIDSLKAKIMEANGEIKKLKQQQQHNGPSGGSENHKETNFKSTANKASKKEADMLQYVQQLQQEAHDKNVVLISLRKELKEMRAESSNYMTTGDMSYLRNVFMKYLEKKDNHGPDLLDSICRVLKLDEEDIKRIKAAQGASWTNAYGLTYDEAVTGIKDYTKGFGNMFKR